MEIVRVEHSRWVDFESDQIPFGEVFSDHMLTAEFSQGAWREPRIVPYGPLQTPPSISALQYGISVFEGLKAHRSPHGDPLIFRPDKNHQRLNHSARRLAMPEVPKEIFIDGLRKLVALDAGWVPKHPGCALYIRPCLYAIDENILVRPARNYRFVIFTCPVGSYYAKPLDLLATTEYVRAFEGGTGDAKPAGNYAASLLAAQDAQSKGFDNVIWLDGRQRRFVEESGVMNIFFVIAGQLVTPPLSGTILAGVTRDSVLRLATEMGFEGAERPIAIDKLFEAGVRGEVLECFGTGTAATIAPIRRIHYQGRDLVMPDRSEKSIGPRLLERYRAIATGRVEDPFGWVVRP